MGRYGFTSPGGMAGNAIQEFLMQRAMQERQMQMDALAKRAQEAEIGQRDQQMALQRQQEERIAQAQRQQQSDLEQERRFRRAGTIAENALPDDPVDDATRALMTEQGYGGQVRQVPGILMQGPLQEGEERPSSPETYAMRGGSRYLSQRAAEDARAGQAEETRAAREAEAERDRQFRAEQGEANRALRGGLTSTQQETAGLRNDLMRQQIEQNQSKIDQDKAWRDKTGEDANRVTQQALDIARRMKLHPGLKASQGIVSSTFAGFSQDAQDYRGLRSQLVAALALPNLGALKGPMSDKDVAFIKNISTRLENNRLSDAETARAVDEAITFLESKSGGAAPAASTGGGGSFRVVGVR